MKLSWYRSECILQYTFVEVSWCVLDGIGRSLQENALEWNAERGWRIIGRIETARRVVSRRFERRV